MKKAATLLVAVLTFSLSACLVPPASESNSVEVTGTVVNIHEGGELDVVIRLRDDDNIYYINRALEQGLTLEGLKERLLYKEVTLKHADTWPGLGSFHLYQVEIKEEIIYTEMP